MFEPINKYVSRAQLRGFLASLLMAVLAIAGTAAHAQLSGTGAISGSVEDPTGAVVAGATVTVTNVDTNVKNVRTATGAGDFNITALIPGTYTVSVTAKGFEGYKQENVTVDALATVGLKIRLTVGNATETVTITAAPPMISTTDATLGGVMDNEMYSSLPLLMGQGGNNDQRRATDFEYLMPGVQSNYTSNNSTDNSGIVNGSGPAGGVSEIYIEGVNLPEADQVGDPRFTWSAIGVDAINQFQVQTAGVSAQYAGQGVENYSIKSGGNVIHGSFYEYMRNTVLDAWAFTSKVPTLNAAGVLVPGGIKPKEIQNEFGMVISGPIIKDKLFLFGNYGQYRNQNGAKYAAYTIPTAAMLGMTQTGTPLGYADFSGYATQTGNAGYHIYDPSTETPLCNPCTRTQFMGMKNGVPTADVIPGSRLSQAATYVNQFWVPYEELANQASYTNNLNYGTSTGLANWYSTGRIDYNQSSRNQIAVIIAFGRQASTGPNSVSGLGPPFNTSQAYHPVTNVDIVKDVFTINSHLVNQFAVGFGRYQSVSVTPDDAAKYDAASLGLLNTPAGQATNGFPEIQWSGGANSVVATQAGYAWNSKVNNTFTETDNLQWVTGKHNFTFGGQYVVAQFNYYKSLGPTGPMDYSFTSTQTEAFSSGTTLNGSTGSGVASYELGAVNGASVLDLNIPGLGTRWHDPSFWAQDDFKFNDKLTVNLGLRWDIFPAIQEAHNIFTFFNPTGVNSITGNLGTLEFTGNGNSQQYCNCKSPSSIFMKNIAPRIGLAYSVDPKTVIRGSYNVNFARGDWTSGSQSGSPATLGLTPSGSTPTVLTTGYPVLYWDGTACAQGTNQGVNCGFNGSVAPPAVPTGGTSLAEYGTGEYTGGTASGMTYWDPYKGSRTPEFINWTFGLQRSITKDMSLTVSYVGSQGHFVSGGEDPPSRHNALTENYAALAGYNTTGSAITPCSGVGTASTNCTTPLLTAKSTAANLALAQSLGFNPPNPFTGSVSYLATNSVYQYQYQFPQFSGVSDTTNFNGNTNFNALEVILRQRNAHGVDFMLNYTYSKSIDDVGTFRVNDNPRLDRSISVTDQPQNLTGTVVYLSPFGKGKMGGSNFLVRAAASDWSISSIFVYHSGSPIAFTGTGCPGDSILGTCMPSVVPGVAARTVSYAKPAGGIVAATGYGNTYSTVPHLALGAFTTNDYVNSLATGANSQLVAAGLGSAAFVPGNAARVGAQNVWGMGTYDLDFAIKRSFPIYEQWKLQFEADIVNSTNHVVFGSPGGGVGGSSYGLITGVSNAPRDVQLAARLSF